MAANHFRGPSELPPLPNARPPELELDDPPARAEGMSGFADAADAFLLRFEACTVGLLVRLDPQSSFLTYVLIGGGGEGRTACCYFVTVGFEYQPTLNDLP